MTGDYLRNDLGIESPDGSSNPIHDHTKQNHGFGYFEDILDPAEPGALDVRQLGRQVPDSESGRSPALAGTDGQRQTGFPSEDLNENQREVTQFGA